MLPVEVVIILSVLALLGNLAAIREKITFPSFYYGWVALGCFVVACFYVFLFAFPETPLETRSIIARWGYVMLFIPMCYPLVYLLARKHIWRA